MEELHEGVENIVGGTLTRFRWSTLNRLAETPRFLGIGTGGDAPTDLGTAFGQEIRSPQLFAEWVYGSPRFPKASHVDGAMPAGRRWPFALWKGPQEISSGTGGQQVSFLFHCKRLYNPATSSMICWDQNLTPVTGLVWELTP